VLVSHLIERLMQMGARSVQRLQGVAEHVVFSVPRELASRAM
jgi:hypothetical protein